MNYLKSFLTSSPSIIINLDPNHHNLFTQLDEKTKKIIYLATFFDSDKISGKVLLKLNSSKILHPIEFSINLIGIIENMNYPNLSNIFFKEKFLIKKPEIIKNEISQYDFLFPSKTKPYESYKGKFFNIKYFLKATLLIKDNKSNNENNSKSNCIENSVEICCIKPIAKEVLSDYLNKEINKPLEVNIGVENIIHIKINLMKTKFFLDDIIIGKILIVKSKIQITNCFMTIKKEEKINIGNTSITKEYNLANFELIEGLPETKDEIFIRYYLNGVKNLTPTYEDIEGKYSVKYFLGFEFHDNSNYDFFKNIVIDIYRMNVKDIKENISGSHDDNDNYDYNKFISIKKALKNDK